jgi:hypothetical protein
MAIANVTGLQRRLQEWSQQAATERTFHLGPAQVIGEGTDASLRDPGRTTQLSIAGYLLGTWHLGCGQAQVLANEPVGWERVRLGAAMQCTALQLRARRPLRHTRQGSAVDLPIGPSANCIAVSLALQNPHAEDLCAAFAALPDACFLPGDDWPLFVRALLWLRAGERPTLSPRLGAYGDVLAVWSGDLGLLARRLASLLDLHLERTHGVPGARAAFDEPGVMLFPAEVLAVRAVRQSLELPWPKVEHALMYTNLATADLYGSDLHRTWPVDPLLSRLQRALR